MLLILGGDNSQNPGPVKDPCMVCGKCVAKNHQALSCDGCKKWCHIGIECGNVSYQQYKKYQQVDNIEWYCPVCMEQNATIQRQEDHSTGNETQTKESSLSPDAAFKFPKREFSLFHLNTHSLFPKIEEIRLFQRVTHLMS